MPLAVLIPTLTPFVLQGLQMFLQKNPSASDEQILAEHQRLIESDRSATEGEKLADGAFADAATKQ